MGAAVDHTDKGKEEGGHQSVAQHLEHCTGAGGLVEHEDGEEHEATVGHGAIGIDVLEVGLNASGEGTVDNGDTSENQEDPTEFVGGFWHEIHGNAEAAITSQLHQHTSMEHGNGGRG